MDGWVKIHRKIWDNPRSRDPEWTAVWLWMICRASRGGADVLWKGNRITLLPGQFTAGREQIAKDTGVNASKVKRIISCLKTDQQIDQQTSNLCSLFSITKWVDYQINDQQDGQPVTSNRPATDQQLTTKQEREEREEVIREPRTAPRETFVPPSVEEISSYCLERKNQVNAERFRDFYACKGWMVGKNKMKDWKAAVRTWEEGAKVHTPQLTSAGGYSP